MFGRKSRRPIEVTRLSSLIAAGVEIAGDVVITDGLRIDGQVEGNVLSKQDARGLLVLSEKGCIVGGAKVYDAVINGTIRGDLEVEHFLELQSNARVTGNIRYRQLQMECGATVDGTLESVAGEAGAPVETTSNVVSLPRAQALAAGEHEAGG
jgi:cytoskeletal protein CcmA (bactofilin family)